MRNILGISMNIYDIKRHQRETPNNIYLVCGVSEAIIAIKHKGFCNYSINFFKHIQVFESDTDFVL